jgi:hypothetical protein
MALQSCIGGVVAASFMLCTETSFQSSQLQIFKHSLEQLQFEDFTLHNACYEVHTMNMTAFSTILQASKHSVEQLQSENFTLRKEIDSLRLGLQAIDASNAYDPSGSTSGAAAVASALLSASGAAGALRPSVFAGGVSASQALGGRTSATGFVGGGSSPGGSLWGSGFGGLLSGAGGARPSVALFSLGGGAAAAGVLPAAVGALSGSGSSSSAGSLNATAARGSVMSAGRASVMTSQQQQSPYAGQAAKVGSAQKVARKPLVGVQSGAGDADTAAAGRAQ